MNRILTFVLIAIICFNSTAKAHIFRNYQMENGLSHNSVWAVIQDGKGFMWFGTNEGLNRFDGKTFKIYKQFPVTLYPLEVILFILSLKIHMGRFLSEQNVDFIYSMRLRNHFIISI